MAYIRQKVARKWRTMEGGAAIQAAGPVQAATGAVPVAIVPIVMARRTDIVGERAADRAILRSKVVNTAHIVP